MVRTAALSMLFALCVVLLPTTVLAKGLIATVEAEETQVVVGDVITMDFLVSRSSGRGPLPTPELPQSVADAFDVGQCASGTSRSVQSINGRRSAATTRRVSCPLTARKVGTFKIAFTVPDGKKRVASNSVSIEVIAADAERPPLEDPTVEAPTDAREDVFLWVSTNKKRAYVGEQVTFRLDVYESQRFLDVSLRTSPTFEGFVSEEIPLPEVYTTMVGDRPFRVRPGVRRALFPQRSGTATIGAAELLISRRKRRFSDPIALEVLPLPALGQPPGFSANNVGRYQISAKVDRDDVQPGEPFTLTYTIAGEGNIELVDPGQWAVLPSVRTYDPKVTTARSRGDIVGGTRNYAFLMIPERPGTLSIPAHDLVFFDPAEETYAKASSSVIEVVVGGDPNAIVRSDEDDDAPVGTVVDDPLAPVFATASVPRDLPRDRWLTQERWTMGMLGIPLIVMFGLAGGWAWRRFGPDDAARGRAQARARRRERIELAQRTVESGDGFHTAVSALLQDVALEVAGPEGTGLPRSELLRLLHREGVETEKRRRLESLLEQCDVARFGAVLGGADERHHLLDDTLSVVRMLSKGTE
ncbi:MAG: BatD family protein [Nannocystaceae bacterium]|nr:BatD family protein [Nannocystaceae bacterium]